MKRTGWRTASGWRTGSSRWRPWGRSASRASAALAIAQSIGEARQLWKSHEALGRVREARGHADAARLSFAAACAVIDDVLTKTHEPGLRAGVERIAEVRALLQMR